jgi:hypothetical protein
MNDAVRMAQTINGRKGRLSPPCASFDLLKTMRDRVFKLAFTTYKQVNTFFKINNTDETTNKQFKGDKVWSFIGF